MSKFLVVLSDQAESDSTSGQHLADFLRVYAPGEVKVVRPHDLRMEESVLRADFGFVCLPSSFSAVEAGRAVCRKWVLFDYFDELELKWGDTNEAFLRSLSGLYLKTHTDERKPSGIGMATLPVPLPGDLPKSRMKVRARMPWRRAASVLGMESRPWDLCFIGSVTYLDHRWCPGISDAHYRQRVQWCGEISERSDWKFWGGLMELPYCRFADLEEEGCPVPEAMKLEGRMRYLEMFSRMARTKVALTPSGNARWTYRHIESVYAGCDIVSNDLSHVRTLLPMPTGCFESVPDYAPISEAVDKVLSQWKERAYLRDEALRHFEGFLLNGRYDSRRPELFERFLEQLD